MPKYCRTYKTMCTCMTCLNTDCARSDRTRLEAEAIFGVRLNADGSEVIELAADSTPQGKGESKAPPETDPNASTRRIVKSAAPGGALPEYPEWRDKPAGPQHMAVAAVLTVAVMALVVAVPAGLYWYLVLAPAKGDGTEAPLPAGEGAEVLALAGPEPTPPPPELPPAVEAEPAPEAPPEPVETERATLEQVARGDGLQAVAPALRARGPRRVMPTEELERLNVIKDHGNEARLAGNVTEARAHYRQAIAENPQYYEGFNNLANTYSEEGEEFEADRLYRQGLAVEPQASHLHFNRGLNFYRAANYVESYRAMLLVLDLNPDDAEALLLAGLCAFNLENYPEAQRLYMALVSKHPDNALGHYNLAVLYHHLGEDSASRTYLLEAQKIARRTMDQENR